MVEIVSNVKSGKRRDIMVIFELFKLHNRTKECYSVISFKLKRGKWERKGRGDAVGWILRFRERERSFSLDYRTIRPSAVFGTRREAALRGKGFPWVPDLGSFPKL